MQPEQQQRIMGYFIEEAKDHLNTIEQGLLDLQSTIKEPELVNEVFRAAHSVKGGAAMLGINSVQKTAHRLEDYFKVLKEHPIKVDQKLESLLLRVFDTLQELLEQLQGPFGLTDDVASNKMTEVDPVFDALNTHMELLLGQAGGAGSAEVSPKSVARQEAAAIPTPAASPMDKVVQVFRRDGPGYLRAMLQLFKKPDGPDTRKQLQDLCQQLSEIGSPANLTAWTQLVATVSAAIANPDNAYRDLAPITIKNLKQAQDLVLAGKSNTISTSKDLETLVPKLPEPEPKFVEVADSDLDDLLAIDDASTQLSSTAEMDADAAFDLFAEIDATPTVENESTAEALEIGIAPDLPPIDANSSLESFDLPPDSPPAKPTEHTGPEVGMAELNSLADLFEGEALDLDATWQDEETVSETATDSSEQTTADSLDFDATSDFSDLLFDEEPATSTAGISSDEQDLADLLGDDFAGEFDSQELGFPSQDNQLLDSSELGADSSPETAPAQTESSGVSIENTTQTDGLSDSSQSDSLSDLFEGLDETELFEEASEEELGLAEADLGLDIPESPTAALEEEGIGSFENEPAPTSDSVSSPSAASIPDPWDISDIDSSLATADVNAESSGDNSEVLSSSDDLDLNDLFEADETPELDVSAADADLEDLFGEASEGQDFDRSNAPANTSHSPGTVPQSIPTVQDPWGDSDKPLSEESEANAASVIDENSTFAQDFGDVDLGFGTAGTSFSSAVETPQNADDRSSKLDASLHSEVTGESLTDLSADDGEAVSLGELDLGINMTTDGLFAEDNSGPNLNRDDSRVEEGNDDSSLFLDLDVEADVAGDLEDLFSADSSLTTESGADATDATNDLDSLLDDSTDYGALDDFALASAPSEEKNASASENLEDTSDSDLALDGLLGDNDIGAASDDLESLFEESAHTDTSESNDLSSDLLLEDMDDLFGLETEDNVDVSDVHESLDLPAENLPDIASLESSGNIESISSDLGFGTLPDVESDEETSESATDLEATVAVDLENLGDLDAAFADIPNSDEADLNLGDLDSLDENLGDLDTAIADTPPDEEIDSEATVAVDLEDLANLGFTSAPSSEADPSESLDDFLSDLDSESSLSNTGEEPEIDALGDVLSDFGNELNNTETEQALEDSLDITLGEDLDSDLDGEMGDLDSDLEGELEALGTSGEFDDLEALLETDPTAPEIPDSDSAALGSLETTDEFDDLEALLETEPTAPETPDSENADDFSDLEALLDGDGSNAAIAPTTPILPKSVTPPPAKPKNAAIDDEFSDLEKLLEDTDKAMPGPSVKSSPRQGQPVARRRRAAFEQTMRVPVKNLDNLNNLVGELVVNRNSLEQGQERLRQFLDNLLHQVQQLSDVGQRMQDLYERSLLESSLLANRQSHRSGGSESSPVQGSHSTGMDFDALEMDRFTGFHTLSQEMIEMIVRVRESSSDIEFLVGETDQVARSFRQVTTQLQEGLTRSRMVPFAQAADRLPRAVRDIAIKCGKQAELQIEGRDILIDKVIMEQLYDPMTHLVNNAITHGIESPEVRQLNSKSAVGTITIRAFRQGNQTVISVSDDGGGIPVDKVKSKAVQKRLISPDDAKTMSDLDVYELLFHPGFSTKDKADDFAGRGVGMDVVRTSLSEIRGAISTDSEVGKGTTFTIRLPLTLSICKALCCISDRAQIAFPMDGVEDMLDVSKDRIQKNEEGQSCLLWRDTLLPFRPLKELLAYNRRLGRSSVYGATQEEDIISVVVLRSGGNFIALQVDRVLGEQEIVIKQLEGPVPKPVGVAGATVLGDGRIMPIADVLELIDLSMGRVRREGSGNLWDRDETQPPIEATPVKSEPTVLIVDDSITVRELLSMTFNKAGYRVEQARDGQEAWEKLRSGLPCEIVFCDIEMPRMDGLELLSRLQKDASLSHLPIAMLTSRGADRHRQMAVQLGASGYFTKPYLEEALLDAAQRMLKGEILVASKSEA